MDSLVPWPRGRVARLQEPRTHTSACACAFAKRTRSLFQPTGQPVRDRGHSIATGRRRPPSSPCPPLPIPRSLAAGPPLPVPRSPQSRAHLPSARESAPDHPAIPRASDECARVCDSAPSHDRTPANFDPAHVCHPAPVAGHPPQIPANARAFAIRARNSARPTGKSTRT
ncbi:hypothetical protein NY08_2773 [Rhodococcus sp. B7740]|nr:hypothetical protein NY08_2773 [Rhodococcus sp. B7740]